MFENLPKNFRVEPVYGSNVGSNCAPSSYLKKILSTRNCGICSSTTCRRVQLETGFGISSIAGTISSQQFS